MFKDRLSTCRLSCGMSQSDVAKFLKITRQAYNHYETGQRQPPHDTLVELAKLFGVTTDYLLGNSDQRIPHSLDEQLEGIDFALYGEVHDLTDEEKKDIIDYIKFKKSQRGDK